jgi:hypothetical protein
MRVDGQHPFTTRSMCGQAPLARGLMTLPAEFSLLNSDLNDFLFASVGDEPNGMPLNVVSALTRLGIDPWEEAARLADLPTALAAEALASMIARLPVGRPQPSDKLAISQRLAGLLPARGQAAPAELGPTGANDRKYLQTLMLLACLGLGAAALFGML